LKYNTRYNKNTFFTFNIRKFNAIKDETIEDVESGWDATHFKSLFRESVDALKG